MIMPTYTPRTRKFADTEGKEIELIFAAKREGVVAHWVSSIGIMPVAKITRKGKVALLQRPKTNPMRAPLHLYHGLLRLQTLNVIDSEDMFGVFDTRHREAIIPQTIHEAKAALDQIIPAVVAELDFISLSENSMFATAREVILQAMQTICRERYVPRRIFNLDAPLEEGPITPVEQTIVEHITNGLYFADGEPLDGAEFTDLIEYIREKIEVVFNEMNGALGE